MFSDYTYVPYKVPPRWLLYLGKMLLLHNDLLDRTWTRIIFILEANKAQQGIGFTFLSVAFVHMCYRAAQEKEKNDT